MGHLWRGVLAAGLLAAWASAASAAPGAWRMLGFDGKAWQLIAEEPLGHADGYVQIHTLTLYREPLPGSNGISIVDVVFDYDCGRNLSRRRVTIVMGPDGEDLGHGSPPADWRVIEPETPAARVKPYACQGSETGALEAVSGEPVAIRRKLRGE